MNRRDFISNAAFFAAGLGLASSALTNRLSAQTATGDLSNLRAAGYGELLPAVSKNTGETFISLPKGFEYNVIGRFKDVMSDGRPTPPLHDGQWAFKVGKELRIVRNHEVVNRHVPREDGAIGSKNHYDDAAGGGTTTLVIDPVKRTVIRDFVSLSGTLINCAGGPTPWGSWITCEETTLGKTVRTTASGQQRGGFAKSHGYCFEVSAAANSEVTPVPLTAMGRFVHEAVSVDRKTGIVYLTEDYNPGGFYRFIPKRKGRLAEGGTLQVLTVANKPNYDTRTGQQANTVLEANWITIEDPDTAEADTIQNAVFREGMAKGAASFSRLEGCDIDARGRVSFTSTDGGESKSGQIWSYEPTGKDKGRLRLLFQSPDRSILHMPDNICLMPKSQLVFVCEDGDYIGEVSQNFLRILTPNGRVASFAQNISKEFPRSEFAGSTFSPDGKTLFVNLQAAGVTLAIWGDWSKFKA